MGLGRAHAKGSQALMRSAAQLLLAAAWQGCCRGCAAGIWGAPHATQVQPCSLLRCRQSPSPPPLPLSKARSLAPVGPPVPPSLPPAPHPPGASPPRPSSGGPPASPGRASLHIPPGWTRSASLAGTKGWKCRRQGLQAGGWCGPKSGSAGACCWYCRCHHRLAGGHLHPSCTVPQVWQPSHPCPPMPRRACREARRVAARADSDSRARLACPGTRSEGGLVALSCATVRGRPNRAAVAGGE